MRISLADLAVQSARVHMVLVKLVKVACRKEADVGTMNAIRNCYGNC